MNEHQHTSSANNNIPKKVHISTKIVIVAGLTLIGYVWISVELTPKDMVYQNAAKQAPQYSSVLTNSESQNRCLINSGNRFSLTHDDYVNRAVMACSLAR